MAPAAALAAAAGWVLVGVPAIGFPATSAAVPDCVAGAGMGPDGSETPAVPGPRIESDPVGSGRGGVARISVCAVDPYAVDPYTVASGRPARQRANASWNSTADWNRSSGFFASARATSSSTHGGRSPRCVPIGVGGSFTCDCAMANGVSPLNGSLPLDMR